MTSAPSKPDLSPLALVTGTVRPGSGWTGLVLGPDHPARAVTGLLTGLHAPEATHLLLPEAVAGPELVGAAYSAAVERRYLAVGAALRALSSGHR